MKIDLRPRCLRCGKLPRGKQQQENLKRYSPYCSYHCQQWHGLEEAKRHLKTLTPNVELTGRAKTPETNN